MAETTILTELAKLVPVLLGGLLAIGGGLASQIVVHRLSGRRDLAKLRRDRIEALVKAIYAHDQWIQAKQTTMIFRNEDHDAPSPLDEARMLQALHLPELAKEVLAIQQAQIPLLEFINAERIKHMKNKEEFVKGWDSAPFDDAYKQYIAAINALVDKCRQLLLSIGES